jgi:predicted Zn-dependent protease
LRDPERIYRQRDTQSFLIRQSKANVDFKGWNKQKYVDELLKAAESEDALTIYFVGELIKKIKNEPGQYSVDPYLGWFLKALEKHRSNDNRTMYVGITEINIYSGDNNYIFSLYGEQKESRASILSYYMMTAKNLSEEYESRSRLTERIAKELVPASLKSLKIPRSADPTCPYSYSSGVQRLDQKTLILSDPIKKELERIRIQQDIGANRP